MSKSHYHDWAKYPTGKIGKGRWCEECARYNVRNSTVDLVAINKEGKLVMHKRNKNPQRGWWALLAGYVGWNETLEEAIKREVKEEVGLKVGNLKFLKVYSNPDRDLDGRQNIAHVFVGEVTGELKIDAVEVREIKAFDWDDLPEKIAFDHRKMIEDYIGVRSKE